MDKQILTITGKETNENNSEVLSALISFYRAFNNRDIDAMCRNWSTSDDVTMSNPLGGIKVGWDEIFRVYENIFNGPASVYVEFYDFKIYAQGDMFCAAGRERGFLKTADCKIALAIRTTRFFRKENKTWQQFHHHGSIDNHELLNEYQSVIQSQQVKISVV